MPLFCLITGKNKLKGIPKSSLSSPFPSSIGACHAGWSEIFSLQKSRCLFSNFFFQASESKREASEDSSPSRVFALHARFAHW